MKLTLLLVVVALLGLLAYIRLAPSDPVRWHVNPLSADSPGEAGILLRPEGGDDVAPTWQMTSEDLLAAFDQVARAAPRTRKLAGSVEEGQITYVTRTKWMGFPDYVSVRAVPAGEGKATLAVFSRLRFGGSDLGVNRARLMGWLARIEGAT
ncbi:MAG: DUF1499 domain-containing protein [Rhodobacteraceae bacterium]|nr:DUF1499 domain-containing protein [Paracoccaceae bacterium]